MWSFRPEMCRAFMVLGLGLIAGCGGGQRDQLPSQTAAKVNKEEVTVHQINAVLARRGGPAQADGEAARKVLEGLIEQELAVQKAAEMRLDRDPRVVQAIESMRREIIVRAYVDKIAEGVTRPSAADIKKYYEEHPSLFRERRVYNLLEFAVQAAPAQVDVLRQRILGTKRPADVVQVLKAEDLKFVSSQAVRPAEQLPLESLPQLASMKDGQVMVIPMTGGARVLLILGSRLQPIDEARAASVIEQFLVNDRKRQLVARDIKALRAAAKIEYVGSYSQPAPVVERVPAPSPAETAASVAATVAPVDAGGASEVAGRVLNDAESASMRKGLGLK